MSADRFNAPLLKIGAWTILELPKELSQKLPSRGQVMVKGTINDFAFRTPLEPNGKGSHWLNVDKNMQRAAKVAAGDVVKMTIESTGDWPEPKVPTDLQTMLDANPKIKNLWTDITPMARWEWIRWVGSTKQPETRQRRIETARSKLSAGERRPCCFNRSMCCVPEVSKNGVLLTPDQS